MVKFPEDKERLMIFLGYSFGFAVLLGDFTLAMIIGLGHVERDTSFGLEIVLNTLSTLGGGFVGWAFGRGQNNG